MREVKPVLFLYHHDAPLEALQEIRAGIEEEGVLYELAEQTEQDEKRLAYHAANHSPLHVGIGVTVHGAALQAKNRPEDRPLFYLSGADRRACRILGQNAARAVKGCVFICPS